MDLTLSDEDVLLVIDVQYDFLPGGALAVPDGDAVIAPIDALAKRFVSHRGHVVLTQDWHPPHHSSFASSHPSKAPYDVVEMPYGPQVLWPDHCVQGSRGAEITRGLETASLAELVIRKGYNRDVDSYSAFREADRHTHTGLAGYLRERGLKRVFCAGLATDFCVAWTALDAQAEGFETFLIRDACRAIDTGGSLARAMADLGRAGVTICEAGDLLA